MKKNCPHNELCGFVVEGVLNHYSDDQHERVKYRVNERVKQLAENERLMIQAIDKSPTITQKQLAAELFYRNSTCAN
jgi:ABC-type uncharacterized transport system involved in gliding motility auxiliary subunit